MRPAAGTSLHERRDKDSRVDHQAFDRLTRAFAAPGSRRALLAALFGAGPLARLERGAAKSRGRALNDPGQAQTKPALRDCPNPKAGKNLSNCDLADRNLRGRNLSGANLSM